MAALAAMTFTGFAGYAVLLPLAPLWAVHGGADAAGAGAVNGVLLGSTVLTQLLVPPALRRLGWGPVLAAGMVLLGLPAVLYATTDALAPVLALSAVRGIGFGVLTVTGSAAVAALVEPGRRGEAIGAYGLAVAVPNLVLLPAGPWVAEHVGFWVVFLVAGLPLAGVPAALRLAAALPDEADDPLGADPAASPEAPAAGGPEPGAVAARRLLRPMLLLLSVTLPGGAVITFTPQMVPGAGASTVGLLLMGLVAAASRWRVGALADRRGAEPFVAPLVLLTAAATALTAWSVATPPRVAVFLVAMALVGLCYGALQNLTLVLAFGAVSRRHHNLASAVWNVGFDAGTGLGAVAVGALAVRGSFAVALTAVAGVALCALPLALRRPAGARPSRTYRA